MGFLGSLAGGALAVAAFNSLLGAFSLATFGAGGTVSAVLSFALNSLVYYLGATAGQYLMNNVLLPIFPSIAPFVGAQLMKLSIYKKFHAQVLRDMQDQQGGTSSVAQQGATMSTPNSSVLESYNTAQNSSGVTTANYDDTSAGAVTPMPMKKMHYEKSKQDGLLLEKIHNIRTKILETAALERKISLNVDGRLIGEAAL